MENNVSGSNIMRNVAEEAKITSGPVRVLAVDDEEFNLEILMKHLQKAGFEAIAAKSGEEAWEFLDANPDGVDVILMDKMMPGISGVDLTKKIKSDSRLNHIVVIMQTAAVGTKAVVEGIEAGAYYYLTKPYAAEVLISIVTAAARDYKQQNQVVNRESEKQSVLSTITRCEFEYKTISEAKSLSIYIANFCSDSSKIALGLVGLLVNAVEHGNLEIGHQRKADCLAAETWDEEVSNRLNMDEYRDRKVRVSLVREGEKILVRIKDEGKGFDPEPYLDFDPRRITEANGRGIAMAKIMDSCKIEYLGNGSEVLVTIKV